ncbi:MAG: phosphate ABC transporter permease subunit PstC [Candidatus Bathyarchaeia archaeon]
MRRDKFKVLTLLFSILFLIFSALFICELFSASSLTWSRLGIAFIFGQRWDPLNGVYGALPFIYGTIVSSTFALLVAAVLGIGVAIFLSEISPKGLREPLSAVMELIAAIPSVIIGLWGIFVLVPFVRDSLQPMVSPLSFIPLFSGRSPSGLSMLAAIIVLSFMITPIVATVAKDCLLMVPRELKEAAYGLGARRYEVIRHVSIPYAKSGIIGGLILGYGRAIGETMAVTMVIGNSYAISPSLLSPAHTMAAVLANEFAEATDALYLSSLTAIALLLILISLVINLTGRSVVIRWQRAAR